MRSSRFIALLVLAACGGPNPRPTAERMLAIASEYSALYDDWDEARLHALYSPDGSLNAGPFREHLTWLREQLGACGPLELMWTEGDDSSRWRRACERGALEFAFVLNASNHVRILRSGAAGVPAPTEVLAAAELLLPSLPWDANTRRPFRHNLHRHAATRLGSCELVQPWVVSRLAALFHVRCDEGGATKHTPAVLRIVLGDDGMLAQADLLPGTAYKGPPIAPADQRVASK